VKMLQGL